ncbi:hypothetical protein FAIPA1_50239 [Frankia sp. AiPs1]
MVPYPGPSAGWRCRTSAHRASGVDACAKLSAFAVVTRPHASQGAMWTRAHVGGAWLHRTRGGLVTARRVPGPGLLTR